jgi:ABC-2 type transport system permease protein
VRDVYFYALTAAGLLMVLTNLGSIGSSYGTPVQPATYRVLELMLSSFNLFVIVVAAVYAGDLVWRDREIRAHQVTDSMPVPTSILLMAKLTALAGALAVMLSPLIPLGIAAQTLLGYHHYQIGLYLGTLFGMRLPDFLLIGAFALGVHAIVNNKYLGHLVVIVGLVGIGLSANFDLVQNVLLIFGSHTGQRYSEMLGYGNQLTLFYWLKAYWAGWMLLLLTAAYLLWVRGEETGPRMRLRGVRDRAGRGTAVAALGGSLLAVGAGGFIFYNTHILNPYIPTQEADRRDADYERTYKKYAALAQPQIARTELAVELFPSEQRGAIGGTEQLVNRTDQPVDTLHVFFDPLARVTALAVTGAQPGGVDASQGYHAYVFDPVLAPGDSAVLSYTMEYRHQGLRNNELDFTIRRNGTFLEPYSLGPKIGYDASRELGGEGARRKNGLPPQEGWPARDSPGATSRPRIGPPGGVEFAATIGTDADQVAIATGDLISSWSRDGRAYFRYEAPQPVPYYGVVSGRWAVSADRWGDIDVYVYYHPTHSRNVGRMIEAVKATLAYGTGRFGPIPFSRVAIVEMPRTLGGTGAQAVAGIIPYGEDAGFSARIRANDIDVPLYLTSHEVAHYWWGYRETPSATRGSAVLSESLAQYTALVVMKHQFDQEHTRRFLRFVLDRYLLGRSREGTGETPLAVTERAYGAYEKGALVMFALQERLGEDRFNSALQGLMDEAVAGSPPYPTTLDLMRHLQEVTPDSLREFLEDAFDRIVLYDNRVASAEATPLDDGRYAVRITLEARKVVADSIGQETEVPMNDPVDLVVYGERRAGGQEPPVLQAGTHRLASGETVVELEVEGKPARVVLDPFCTLVDRRPQDNERSVKLLSAQPARR